MFVRLRSQQPVLPAVDHLTSFGADPHLHRQLLFGASLFVGVVLPMPARSKAIDDLMKREEATVHVVRKEPKSEEKRLQEIQLALKQQGAKYGIGQQ